VLTGWTTVNPDVVYVVVRDEPGMVATACVVPVVAAAAVGT
jgi:hypothetical protein